MQNFVNRKPFAYVGYFQTDLWMPAMDGKTLVGEIRKNEQWKTLPVYAVTADTEAEESISSFGFTGMLMKPITLEKLRELLP